MREARLGRPVDFAVLAAIVRHAAVGLVALVILAATSAAEELPSRIEALELANAPRIDGDLTDWPEGTPDRLDRREQVIPAKRDAWQGPDDVSAELRLGADAEALYVALRITDDQAFHPGEPWWVGDSVELLLDLVAREDPEPPGQYDSGCWQIFLMPRNPEQSWGVASRGPRMAFDDGGLRGIEIAAREREHGYDIEARIPWAALEFDPTATPEVGFALAINDSDTAPGTPGTYLSWNGKTDLYRNPRNFGRLRLPRLTAPPIAEMAPEPVSGLGFGDVLLIVVLGLAGVVLLAGPGARWLARVGPHLKLAGLGVVGLVALVLYMDARRVATDSGSEVRGELDRLAADAEAIAIEADGVGALPPTDAGRREAVLRTLLEGGKVPCVLPPEETAFVVLDPDLAGRRVGEPLPYDFGLGQAARWEVADHPETGALELTLLLRGLRARGDDAGEHRVGVGTLEIYQAGEAPHRASIEAPTGVHGPLNVRVDLPIRGTVEALVWTPEPAGRRARLRGIRDAEGRGLVLSTLTADGIPILGGPESPDLGRALAVDAEVTFDLPFVLGADRLWAVVGANDAFPRRLGDEAVLEIRIDYDEGEPSRTTLRNGKHVAAAKLPRGLRRPADMASRVAYRWREGDLGWLAHDAVALRIDPARRARRVTVSNSGGAGTVVLVAMTLVRSSRLEDDARLGLTSSLDHGMDAVYVLAPDTRFQERLGRGAPGDVRIDRRVGTPPHTTRLRLAAPLPARVADKQHRTDIALLVCLAMALLLLAFLAADAVERFRFLTWKLAFSVLVAALIPLAAVVFLIDSTTRRRLEAEQVARAQNALAAVRASLEQQADRARDATQSLSRHLARRQRRTAVETARLARMYRSGAGPADGAHHTLIAGADGTRLDVAGPKGERVLANPRFLGERSGTPGYYVSPWDGLLLVTSALRGPPERSVRATVGTRVDDLFLREVGVPALPGADACIAVLDARGRPLASAGREGHTLLLAIGDARDGVREGLAAEPDLVLPHVRGEQLAIVGRLPGLASSSEGAWLAVGLDRSGIDSTLGELRQQLAWLTLFGVLLITGVASMTARRVADPIRGLVRVTEAVRRGTFDVAVPPAGTDEVGNLTLAFDQMRLDLKHRVADLDFLRSAQDALAASLDYGRRTETVLELFERAASPSATILLDAASGRGPLTVAAERGRETTFSDRPIAPAKGGWLEAGLATETALEILEPGRDPRVEAEGKIGERLVEGRPAWLVHPLRTGGDVIGLVVLAWDDPDAVPRGEERRLLDPLAGTCALALHNARLYRLAALDDVTRLPGATAFEAALRADVEKAAAGEKSVTLLRIGLDHAEHVAMRRSVELARELLRAEATALQGVAGDLQTLGRLREHELAVRLVGASPDEARGLAERIRTQLAGVEVVPESGGEPAGTSVTIGLARAPDDATSVEFLLDAAGRALSAARREGGDRVEDATRLDSGLVELPPYEEGAVFRSERMVRIVEQARRAARTDSAVLITGETGTGKEVIATLIHRRSARSERPFVAVNCAAFPETLLESELFGHERGAFTGAERRREGRFELADGGTLFLDEIAEMAPSAQVKLLRVLQEQQFTRLGGTRPVQVDVRIISATNQDLEVAVEEGTLREDLYYRLNVIRLELPPLRDRREEIPLFVERFLEEGARRAGRTPKALSSGAMDLLYRHPWPGNVRELKNVIERAEVFCDETSIGPEHLRLDGKGAGGMPAPRAAPMDGLNERQRKLLDHLARHGRCTNREYQDLADTSARTGLRDLQDLMDRGLLIREGKRRGAVYRLP